MISRVYNPSMDDLDPTSEAKLILDIYEYAQANDLDIENEQDVKEILQSLGYEKINDELFERLMAALSITDQKIQADVSNRKKFN